MIFRAIWPITDETTPYAVLCKQARDELPRLIAQSHSRLTSPGRFSVSPSEWVPGSGRTTESVLVFEAPAEPTGEQRAYWRRPIKEVA
ncbi:hypothetical protein [Pimelobacter simplex]|uniref:hypothetical protein n=1 Tax=Nocardioides simplex TaxID=2045 RepID=UPI003AAD7476